ncbi:MAG: hypothetical protein ABR580_08870 [Halomonas sp.]
MISVWGYQPRGDTGYTLVRVAVNDLIMLLTFAPTVILLLGVSNTFV